MSKEFVISDGGREKGVDGDNAEVVVKEIIVDDVPYDGDVSKAPLVVQFDESNRPKRYFVNLLFFKPRGRKRGG